MKQIGAHEMVMILTGCMFGVGIFVIPGPVAAEAGQNAWLSMLLGALTPGLVLVLILSCCRRFPAQDNLYTALTSLVGQPVTRFFFILLSADLILAAGAALRFFSVLIRSYLLNSMPAPMIMLVMLCLIYYVLRRGIQTVSRWNTGIFYGMMPLFALLLFYWGQGALTNVLPLGGSGTGIVRGSLAAAFSYTGIEAAWVYYFLAQDRGRMLQSGMRALFITLVSYSFIVFTCVLVLGPGMLSTLMCPLVVLLKGPLGSIEMIDRFEFVFLAIWCFLGLRLGVNILYAATAPWMREGNTSAGKIALTLGLVFSVGMIPGNVEEIADMLRASNIGFVINGIFFPLVFHLVWFIRQKKQVGHE
jgi:spore germination protein (amino acid permease)